MRRFVAALTLSLCACSSTATAPAPDRPQPPQGFPDLTAFTAVDPAEYTVGGHSFVSPQQVDCVLDFGPDRVTVCSGDIPGFPASIAGDGCAAVRKPEQSASDAAYIFERSDRKCGSARSVPMPPGHKLVGENGTCAVGDNGLVACIDADNKHGFVLQPSGSWAF
jgi:hypothetical protein